MFGKGRILMGLAGILAVALPARAQIAVWTEGGGGNNYWNVGSNWMGGSPPPADGSNTVDVDYASNGVINVNVPANVAGIVFTGPPTSYSQYSLNDSGGSLTIGSGGISFSSVLGVNVYFSANIVLSQDQTWTPGFMNQTGGVISGSGSLTTTGNDYIFGSNTFTGGMTIASGSLNVGAGPAAGTGTLTLEDNTGLFTFFTADTLPNAVVLGNNVTMGTAPNNPLTLTGPVTLTNSTTNLYVSSGTVLYLEGQVSGPPSTALTFAADSGYGPIQPIGGGAQVVLEGGLNQVSSITVSSMQLILAPLGNPATAYTSLGASGLQVGIPDEVPGYLGLDGSFATTPGAVSNFISTFGPSMGASINGTLGFDTVASPGSPQTFSDPIDLSQFTSPGFAGLGSATSAILSGAISPSLLYGGAYIFGGGGGTLTVTSDLEDHGGTSLVMTQASTPVTVIMQGANNYTGGVLSEGGVLVLDSSAVPSGGITLQGGYVGATEASGLSSDAFVGLFNAGNTQSGIIGFDQHTPDPSSPRYITDDINLTGFNTGSLVFIGTSTNLELTPSATIEPLNSNYAFAGVKGGILTIDTQLTDGEETPNSVTLGLINPIESNGSSSVINITGDNTYSGGTTINSGTVFISSDNAFGTGLVTIPNTPGTSDAPYVASYGGNPVTIMNPIEVGSQNSGSTQGVSLGNVQPSGNDMLVLDGVISDDPCTGPGVIAITGPVTLGAANTYSGGTLFSGEGNAEALVTNSASFGTGGITIQDSATIAPAGGNVCIPNAITINNSALNLGQSGNSLSLMLSGIISGYGNINIASTVELDGLNTYGGSTLINGAEVIIGSSSPFGTSDVQMENGASLGFSTNSTIVDLNGDPTNAVNLSPGATLTLDADSNGGQFNGTITGDASDSLVKTDTGTQYLYGVNTYGGGTTVTGGTLVAGNSGALGTGAVTVQSGAELAVASNAALTVPITLETGGSLGGSGSFAGSFTFAGGSNVLPGSTIAGEYTTALTFTGNVTFGSGGAYGFNLGTASGTAGFDYTTVSIDGSLTIMGGPFTIMVQSINPGGGNPGMASFNAAQAYSWTLVTAAGGITGFNPTYFSVDTSAFQNATGGGNFSVGESGDTLTLNFTPVPEPSTWALMLGGAAAAAALFRLRGRGRSRATGT
jgi:autotransporter-associated beta strand protein